MELIEKCIGICFEADYYPDIAQNSKPNIIIIL